MTLLLLVIPPSTLALLVPWFSAADDPHDAVTLHDLAVTTDFLD
jgi:hypothetical protein